MPTTPPTIAALPTPPSRDDPANFAARGDAFLGALPTFRSETNSVASNVYANAVEAATSASTATTQATNAAASAGTATTQATNASGSASNAAASATSAGNSANAAAASYDAFDDRYLGSKTSDPTLDNDGNALLTGALYWNSAADEMRVWNASAWVQTFLPAGAYVTVAGTQTLTNKTLVTPVLGTPTSGDLSNCTADGTNAVGFRSIPQNSQSANYTLVLADAGKHIYHPASDANARTFTIPANSSVAYPVGTAITFINRTSQVVSIAITTDTMYLSSAGTTGTRSLAQWGSATAVKITSTEWLISGSGLT